MGLTPHYRAKDADALSPGRTWKPKTQCSRASDYNELLPGEMMKVERIIRAHDDSMAAELVQREAKGKTLEQLTELREMSAAEEQRCMEQVSRLAEEWDGHAERTMIFDMALKYAKTPPLTHTSNQWADEGCCRTKSNMVYSMSFHIYEETNYNHDVGMMETTGWKLDWYVYVRRANTGYHFDKSQRIAGQTKRFTDKEQLNKYLDGRIKAHAHLFTEVSPPVPRGYEWCFTVEGMLLPGYRLHDEEGSAEC
jgi:hypothetical protein